MSLVSDTAIKIWNDDGFDSSNMRKILAEMLNEVERRVLESRKKVWTGMDYQHFERDIKAAFKEMRGESKRIGVFKEPR